MSYYMLDRQTDSSHPCILCGGEIYGDYDVCQICQERMKENNDE